MSQRVICHLCSFSPEYPGSFVDALLCLADYGRRVHQAETLCVFPEEARTRKWLQRLEQQNVHYAFVPRKRNVIASVRSALRDYEPVLFHTHFFLFDLAPVVLKVTRYRRAGIVWHYHNPAVARLPHRIKDFIKLRMVARCAGVQCIAVGDGVYRSVLEAGLPGDRLTLIHNGIDASRFAPDPERRRAVRESFGASLDCTVYLVLGLDPLRKGVDLFIQAAAELHSRRRANALFLIIGRGETREFVASMPEHSRLGSSLRVIEPGDSFGDLLGGVDVMVSCSRSEGLSYAVLESMAAERLVISSDIPGVRETYGRAGGVWLFPSGDRLQLARLMGDIADLAEPERTARGQENARLVKTRYSLESWAGKVGVVYERVLGG